MELYYTTSVGQDEEQTKPALSLGGYRSSITLPNAKLSNLFGEVSQYTIEKDNDQYIALILWNTTGIDATDVTIWFEVPTDTYTNYEIAAVDLAADPDGVLAMERVRDINTRPLVGTFVDATGIGNAQDIGDILNDGMVGLWIKRTLNMDNIDTDQEDLIYKVNESDDLYVQRELNTEDEILLNIEWT